MQGLYGGPTLINNVETLSNVPRIVANGAEWFKGFGTEQSPGTKVVSVSGGVRRPGNYEVELGIPTRELIYDLAGGPLEGREVKAFYPGGSSSPVLTAEEGLDLPYSFEAMAEAGSMLGSGSIIVADDTRLDPAHGAAHGALLPPRVLRQVHPLPRGHQLDGEDAGTGGARRGDADGPRHRQPRSRRTSSATASACSATRWRCRSARWCASSAHEFEEVMAEPPRRAAIDRRPGRARDPGSGDVSGAR